MHHDTTTGFRRIDLAAGHFVQLGPLPAALVPDAARFETLWRLHPDGFHTVKIFGRSHPVPRWSATYGCDYRFSGAVQRAVPVPDLLQPYLEWCTALIDARLNALLLNWYDADRQHRIGPHRDDEAELVAGAPIVTISLGASRCWRLKHWRAKADRDVLKTRYDIEVDDGAVLVLPWATNLAFTHEVPHRKTDTGRRISITVRGFG